MDTDQIVLNTRKQSRVELQENNNIVCNLDYYKVETDCEIYQGTTASQGETEQMYPDKKTERNGEENEFQTQEQDENEGKYINGDANVDNKDEEADYNIHDRTDTFLEHSGEGNVLQTIEIKGLDFQEKNGIDTVDCYKKKPDIEDYDIRQGTTASQGETEQLYHDKKTASNVEESECQTRKQEENNGEHSNDAIYMDYEDEEADNTGDTIDYNKIKRADCKHSTIHQGTTASQGETEQMYHYKTIEGNVEESELQTQKQHGNKGEDLNGEDNMDYEKEGAAYENNEVREKNNFKPKRRDTLPYNSMYCNSLNKCIVQKNLKEACERDETHISNERDVDNEQNAFQTREQIRNESNENNGLDFNTEKNDCEIHQTTTASQCEMEQIYIECKSEENIDNFKWQKQIQDKKKEYFNGDVYMDKKEEAELEDNVVGEQTYLRTRKQSGLDLQKVNGRERFYSDHKDFRKLCSIKNMKEKIYIVRHDILTGKTDEETEDMNDANELSTELSSDSYQEDHETRLLKEALKHNNINILLGLSMIFIVFGVLAIAAFYSHESGLNGKYMRSREKTDSLKNKVVRGLDFYNIGIFAKDLIVFAVRIGPTYVPPQPPDAPDLTPPSVNQNINVTRDITVNTNESSENNPHEPRMCNLNENSSTGHDDYTHESPDDYIGLIYSRQRDHVGNDGDRSTMSMSSLGNGSSQCEQADVNFPTVHSQDQHRSFTGTSIPSQVLVTLRFLAKGNFLSETADLHGISKSSASRIIPRVCSALVKHYPVSFPTDQQTLAEMKLKFHNMAGFPNVIGCIDGVLIPIQTPYLDESSYICRKGFHAINVQAVADPDMRFINVVVKWPGSTHDSFILSNSNIAEDLSRQPRGYLLGDSGYPLKTWLMTPFLHAIEIHQRRYNTAHTRTRNIVERSFGILKARFRCLDRSGGHLCYQPRKAVPIIASCFSLHNIAMKKRMPVPDCANVVSDHDSSVYAQQPTGRAQEMRDTIARIF